MEKSTARNSVNGEAKSLFLRRWMRWIWTGGLLWLAGGSLWGELRIVTTVGMVRDIAAEVAGPEAEVTGLMGSGVDPHLYKPTRGDVVALSQADVILYNGLHLEGRMGEIFERMERRDTPVLAVAEAALERAGRAPLPGDDPHVWMDVFLWSHAVEVVADFLAAVDEENAAGYAERAAAYRRRLVSLHAYGQEVMGSIPAGRRVLVTAHDAFSYFGEAYGVEVRGIQGLSTESEAGVRDVERLLDSIVKRGIPAIFVEDSVSDKNVRALVEGARARGHELEIGGTLYSDAMGPQGNYTGTYIGMLDHNLTMIARALGGSAPEGGFKAKAGKDN